MGKIDVPSEVYETLEAPEDERDRILRRELAGLSTVEFHGLLGRRSVERHYSDADLGVDADYASS